MIILDYKDTRPIYEQIVDKLQKLILSGALTPDQKMPSVRSLAMELSINPNTIQRAYMALEQEGWIYSVRGRGSFVADAAQARDERRKAILKELQRLAEEAALAGFTKEEFRTAVDGINWPKRGEDA